MVPDNMYEGWKRQLLEERIENEIYHVKESCIETSKNKKTTENVVEYVWCVDLPLLEPFEKKVCAPLDSSADVCVENEVKTIVCKEIAAKLLDKNLDWDAVLKEFF